MILPEKALIIKRDGASEEPQSGLILTTKTVKKDTGVIAYAAPELEHLKGKKVKFREAFIEEDIDVYGEKLIYIRDWSQGVYFID